MHKVLLKIMFKKHREILDGLQPNIHKACRAPQLISI